jgi:hypothetical protein
MSLHLFEWRPGFDALRSTLQFNTQASVKRQIDFEVHHFC